jgi:TolB protein
VKGKFGYRYWFNALKAGHSFATNGPMLFLTVNGQEPGATVAVPAGAGKTARHIRVHAEVSSARDLDRVEIVWKGKVVKTVAAAEPSTSLTADYEFDADETGWIAARAFEKPGEVIRFAQTSPVYVHVAGSRGVVAEDMQFFLNWIDREMKFYKGNPGFKTGMDEMAMLDFFRRARAVYAGLLTPAKNK